jgi:hypothetical protein
VSENGKTKNAGSGGAISIRYAPGLAWMPLGYYLAAVTTLTIKLEPEQEAWLDRQAKTLRRSKGGIIRDLIKRQQAQPDGSLGQALADLCGCVSGSKDLSTRPLRGYGRR